MVTSGRRTVGILGLSLLLSEYHMYVIFREMELYRDCFIYLDITIVCVHYGSRSTETIKCRLQTVDTRWPPWDLKKGLSVSAAKAQRIKSDTPAPAGFIYIFAPICTSEALIALYRLRHLSGF
jgi:hypothetical protein